MTERWDAVIVGGGPAGAATALHLAHAGASVLLVDRAQFPRHKPCSEYLSPATTALLDRLGYGVREAVERASPAKVYGMKVVAPGGTAMCGRFGGAYSFALPRATFDAILLGAAERAGAVVRERTSVEAVVWDRGAVAGVVARTRAGRRDTWRARVVVGADGLRSVVAGRLGPVRRSAPRRVAFTAHVADVVGVEGVGELHVGRCGYVGLGPVGGGVTTVALVVPLALVRARRHDYRAGFFAALERFPGLAGRFDPQRLVRAVLTTGPFAQWARVPAAPGALLVGDAADFFDPFTGQGIYAALRGAELAAATLVPALGRADGGPLTGAALAPYAAARRRAFWGKWLLERLIGLGVGWPALVDRVVTRLARRADLADLLVGATGNIVPARQVFAPHVLVPLVW
ncbi:MAG TPA: FAD-dependent oxidoreductase [Gemmatimonadales bacterium]|nr:FAD-dependent oxidoreductase [Gemmatimonadales bacterium]